MFALLSLALSAEAVDRDPAWTQPHHGATVLLGTGPVAGSSLGLGVQLPAGDTWVHGLSLGLVGAAYTARRYYGGRLSHSGAYRWGWFGWAEVGLSAELWSWIEPEDVGVRVASGGLGITWVRLSGWTFDTTAGLSYGVFPALETDTWPWLGFAFGYSFDTR